MNGKWVEAANLSEKIGVRGRAICTTISPDGKYMFFNGSEDGLRGTFWIRIDRIIEKLRSEQGIERYNENK